MDHAKELEKLHQLKEKDVLTEEEYNEQKEAILAKMKNATGPEAPPPPNPEAKSKMAAGLLGIFLGGFGIHRFYLGYVGIGIAQIAVTVVTCGAGALWGFIEGILILAGTTITTDAKGEPLTE
jgi:hypothetical protein